MARGTLRVYLGAAPGVGKTFAMLNEGRRRHDRGTDVVVGYVETHGRPRTAEQIGGPRGRPPARSVEYRGTTFEEMDLDAVLARQPEVALVDELAHTNAPGTRNAKRWQDVNELLDAGIDVISTVNIQHLESINDVVERITGIVQRETIPDEVVRAGRSGRARRHDARGAAPADGARQHLRAREDRRRPRRTTSAKATSPRCGSSRCCGSPTRSTSPSRTTARATASHEPWETRERVVVAITGAPGHRGPDPPRVAHRPARPRRAARRPRPQRAGPGRTGNRAARVATASCSRRSAASTTRWPGATSPPHSSTSPEPRTPRSSSSAAAARAAGTSSRRAR